MTDWKQPIYDEVERHKQRRTEITTELNSLLIEIENGYTVGRLRIEADLVDDENLVWEVKLSHKKFQIADIELVNWQFNSSPGVEINTKEALQQILVYKMKL